MEMSGLLDLSSRSPLILTDTPIRLPKAQLTFRSLTCNQIWIEPCQQGIKALGVYSLVNSTSASPKKTYQKPTLRVYGDIREVTKTTGNSLRARADGGGGAMTKTA